MSHLFVNVSGLSFKDTRTLLRKEISKKNLNMGISPDKILIDLFKYKRSSFTNNLGKIRWDKIGHLFESIFKDENLSYKQIMHKYYRNEKKK